MSQTPLPPTPLTREDRAIQFNARSAEVCRMQRGDRGDAELMYQAQRARDCTFPGWTCRPLSLIGPNGDIACGGALWDRDPVWRHRHST